RAIARQRLLDDRMPAAGDDEDVTVIDLRPRVIAFGGKLRERARYIETRQRLGAQLDVVALRDHLRRQALEYLQLEAKRSLGGAGDLRFKFAQLSCREADLPGERLAMDEGAVERRRHQPFAVLGGDLDKIAQHIVVLDLEDA